MGEDGPGDAFAAELARLKGAGSAILVRSGREASGVCRDLLGSDDEPRRRVLVRAAEFDELPVPGDDSVVVDATADDSRSVTTYDPRPFGRYLAGGCSMETVGTAVRNEVERLATEDVESGELRVCLGRLDPFLSRTDAASVTSALGPVFDSVRAAGGMAHVHLSPDVRPSVVEHLRPVVDVTVDVRTTPRGARQQRWQLHEADIDTGWLQMPFR